MGIKFKFRGVDYTFSSKDKAKAKLEELGLKPSHVNLTDDLKPIKSEEPKKGKDSKGDK